MADMTSATFPGVNNNRSYFEAVGKEITAKAKGIGIGKFAPKSGGTSLPPVDNTKFVKVNGSYIYHRMGGK